MRLDEYLVLARDQAAAAPLGLRDPSVVEALVSEGMAVIRQDLAIARKLALAAAKTARALRHPIAIGQAARLMGHVELLGGRSSAAVRCYSKARQNFELVPLERAATAVAMLQGLAYLGRFDEAFEVATEALTTFREAGDDFRAARVEANLANALHRLDRLDEARDHYRRALAALERHKAVADIAIVSRNYGVCLMGLLDFEEAERMYAKARLVFESAGDRSLAVEVDLNRAYLLGRRGQMRDALALYRELREGLPEVLGYEVGHCLLDQADLMLEAGLWTDSLIAAKQARAVFESIGSSFEIGKSRLLEAVASLRLGEDEAAGRALKEARRRLRKVPNQNWKALAHMAQAEREQRVGRNRMAMRSLLRAEASGLAPERLPLLRQQMAFLAVELNDGVTFSRLEAQPAARAMWARRRGDAAEAEVAAREALGLYDAARQSLPAARLRQAVALAQQRALLECFRALSDPAERLQVVLRLKNQALAEVMRTPEILTGLKSAETDEGRARQLTEAQVLSESEAMFGVQLAKPPVGTSFVELFEDAGKALAFVLRGEQVTELPLGEIVNWQRLQRSFRLHLRRSRGGAQEAAEASLVQLHRWLEPALEGAQIVVVGRESFVMGLPLHAAKTPRGWLMDETVLTYAPSLTCWNASHSVTHARGKQVVALGEHDDDAPAMRREAELVANLAGGWLAPADKLRDAVSVAGLLHLAAHGFHREDNPRFSSLRLGDHTLDVVDVLQWRCLAELVVLSGCSTASASPGDTRDPEGFVEAFLVAGSRAVLATLWDVADAPAHAWMSTFYRGLGNGLAGAIRGACAAVRERWPHPAHWAGFALFGNSEISCETWQGKQPIG